MKKILLGAAALSVMFATSCKKNDDKSGPSSTFTLAGTSYTPSSVVKGTNLGMTALMGTDGTNAFYVLFSAAPTASGTYKIVENASANDQLQIVASSGQTNLYSSIDVSATANVTVNGGKITVTIPEISAERTNVSTAATDTVKISGTLIEN